MNKFLNFNYEQSETHSLLITKSFYDIIHTSEIMFTFNKSFFDNIVRICLKAGKQYLKNMKSQNKNFLKEDSSPVTEADLKADDIIVDQFIKLDKSIPCISEESSD